MNKLFQLFIFLFVAIALLSILGFLLNVLVGVAAFALKIVFIIAVLLLIYKGLQYVMEKL